MNVVNVMNIRRGRDLGLRFPEGLMEYAVYTYCCVDGAPPEGWPVPGVRAGNMDSTLLKPCRNESCARAVDPKLGTLEADGKGTDPAASVHGVHPPESQLSHLSAAQSRCYDERGKNFVPEPSQRVVLF
jgi:hypothetical protein